MRVISMLALTCIAPAALLGQTQGNWKALGAGHGTWVGAGYGKRELDPASVRVLGPDHFVATTRWRDGNCIHPLRDDRVRLREEGDAVDRLVAGAWVAEDQRAKDARVVGAASGPGQPERQNDHRSVRLRPPARGWDRWPGTLTFDGEMLEMKIVL